MAYHHGTPASGTANHCTATHTSVIQKPTHHGQDSHAPSPGGPFAAAHRRSGNATLSTVTSRVSRTLAPSASRADATQATYQDAIHIFQGSVDAGTGLLSQPGIPGTPCELTAGRQSDAANRAYGH